MVSGWLTKLSNFLCFINLHFAEEISNMLGAIQVLCNAMGGKVSNFPEKSITKVYGSMLSALRGGGWVSIFQQKSRNSLVRNQPCIYLP